MIRFRRPKIIRAKGLEVFMKKMTAYGFFTLIILIFSSSTQAQRSRDMAPSRRQNMFGRDLFMYQSYNFADSTSDKNSCMEFHIAVVNDLLTFVKTDDQQFKARYEVIIVIYNDKKEAIVERSVSNRVTAATFEETNSRINPALHTISVVLPPGRYKGVIRLSDLESGESLSEDLELTFRDFDREHLHLSDIMFLNKIDSTQSETNYVPNLRNIFDDLSSAFSAYVEVYPPESATDVNVKLSILSNKGQMLFEGERNYTTPRKAVSVIIPFRQHLTRPGEYYLLVNATGGEQTAKVQRMFSVSWGNLPLKSNNLDIAIEQLAIIAHKSTVDSMRKADDAEKQRLYDKFWQERDPTPGSERNELKDEYFQRIDFCNQNFTEISSDRQGWQTDRGKVFLVYGPPNSVDRQDSEINMPATEVWNYTRLSRRYYFADRTGDGIYRLIKVE
jgi:GWxTD domain-containing protein